MKMIDFDLLPFAVNIKRKVVDGQTKVWDPIRKNFFVLTPEEMVRQCIIEYLIKESHYSKNHIAVEKGLKTIHKDLRFDVLVYNHKGEKELLIECKAPSVPLSQMTFDQIAHYNTVLQVPYLWISNGHSNLLCKVDWKAGKIEFLKDVEFLKK